MEASKPAAPIISITLFGCVRDNQADQVLRGSWVELVEAFQEETSVPYEHKEDAPLFTSCEFAHGRRAKKNVMHSGMAVLDIDGTRNSQMASLDQAALTLTQNALAGLLYTTASHTPEQNRFRVLIPFEEAVNGPEYTAAFHGLDHFFGGVADTSKQGSESLFYLPGAYKAVRNDFIVTEGAIRSAAEWAALAPAPISPSRSSGRVPGAVDRSRSGSRPLAPRRALRRARWSSLFDCPFVTSKMINDYRTCARADNWHVGMYAFMCSVAALANRSGHQLTAEELADLARRLDEYDGGYYPNRDLAREAQNALSFFAH
ncbi:hypothetical protein [Azospirillum argentinense]